MRERTGTLEELRGEMSDLIEAARASGTAVTAIRKAENALKQSYRPFIDVRVRYFVYGYGVALLGWLIGIMLGD